MAIESGENREASAFSSAAEGHSELLDYLGIILQKWYIIGTLTTAVLVSASYHYASLPNLYTATAQIIIERVGEEVNKMSEQMQLPAFNPEGSDDYLYDYYGTQIAILKSGEITRRVEREMGPGIPPYLMDAQRVRKTSIVALSVTCGDPAWSASIANKFAEAFIQRGTKEQLFITEQLLQFIPDSIENGSDLNKSVLNKGVASKLSSVNKSMFAEQLKTISEDPVIMKSRADKMEAAAKLTELLQYYLPQHPDVQSAMKKMEYSERTLKERTAALLDNVRATLTGQIQVSNVRIVEEARPPSRPSSPKRVKGIVTFGLLGFFASAALVVTLQRLNQKIVTQNDLKSLNIPFLGYIPFVKELRNKRKALPSSGKATILEALKTNAFLADAVASVRTHVLFSIPYEHAKRIMVVSSLPAEGKTTMSIYLAVSLASMGRKILLIEADLRKPSIGRYLHLPPDAPGLSDYLLGNATIEEIQRQGPLDTLKIITGGKAKDLQNIPELLSSERFRRLLDDTAGAFDRVVIDVPPVLYIPEGLIVAKIVHTGILVCRSGTAHRKTAKIIMDKFKAIGFTLIGAIITQADYSKEHSYYKSYYSYYKTK